MSAARFQRKRSAPPIVLIVAAVVLSIAVIAVSRSVVQLHKVIQQYERDTKASFAFVDDDDPKKAPTRLVTGEEKGVIQYVKPGVFFNESTPVFIWGARLTTEFGAHGGELANVEKIIDYGGGRISSQRRHDLFLDFWVHDTYNIRNGRFKINNITSVLPMTDSEIARLRFNARVIFSAQGTIRHDRRNRICTTFENKNDDVIPRSSLHRFRCDLRDLFEGLQHTKEVYIQIWPLETSLTGAISSNRVQFIINRTSDSVGLAGPVNSIPSIPFHARADHPVKLSLCVGGISASGVEHLPEFVQHHLRLGVDYIVIGLHGKSQKIQDDMAVRFRVAEVSKLLQPLIRAGIISLMPMEIPAQLTGMHRDLIKTIFYESCLFHVKGISQYVAIWDIDEFFIPNNLSLKIPDILESSQPNEGCQEWCYVTFPSVSVYLREEGEPKLDIPKNLPPIAKMFPLRQAELNYIWRKSIAKTKNAFNAGFHTFGSCLTPRGEYVPGQLDDPDGCSVRLPNQGSLHHYLGLFYLRSMKHEPPYVRAEYASIMQALNGSFAVQVRSLVDGSVFAFNRIRGSEPLPPPSFDEV